MTTLASGLEVAPLCQPVEQHVEVHQPGVGGPWLHQGQDLLPVGWVGEGKESLQLVASTDIVGGEDVDVVA